MIRSRNLVIFAAVMAVFAVALPAMADTAHKLYFSDPNAMDMIQIPYDQWQFTVEKDPVGEAALFYPQGTDAQRIPNTYGSMRYALLNTPAVNDFELNYEVMDGWPYGETRSQLLVFGWQDYRNYDFVYLTYTDTARVTRLVDGKQRHVNEPFATNLWPKGSPLYIPVRLRVTTEGDFKVINVWVDGEPAGALDGTKIPVSQYTPGKVGIGSLSYSNVQAMFVKNIELTVLD